MICRCGNCSGNDLGRKLRRWHRQGIRRHTLYRGQHLRSAKQRIEEDEFIGRDDQCETIDSKRDAQRRVAHGEGLPVIRFQVDDGQRIR